MPAEGDRLFAYVEGRLACGLWWPYVEELIFGAEKAWCQLRYPDGHRYGAPDGHRMGYARQVGFQAYSGDEQEVFPVSFVTQQKMYLKTADIIDTEVRRIIDEAYDDAEQMLKDRRVSWKIWQGLLEYETLNGDEIKIIVDGGSLSRDVSSDDEPPNLHQASTWRPANRGVHHVRRRVNRA